MEDNFKDYFNASKRLFSEYLEARWRLVRLMLIEKTANVFGVFLGLMVAAILSFFVVLFLGFLLAYWISGMTGSFTIGFLVTALVFIVLFAVVLIFRRPLIHRPLANAIIREICSELDDEEEDPEEEEDNFERYLKN